MKPFFTYYGGKTRAARHYPAPEFDVIVEPFAGSAGYSLNYPDRAVLLRDSDPVIVETWRYLIQASADEIVGLPDLAPGESVDDLDVPLGARYLTGWWLNKGASQPHKTPSAWMRRPEYANQFWGPRIRDRIAGQLERIRHWTVEVGGYESAPDAEATWFVDPPYVGAGHRYRHGSRGIDYGHLAEWCKSRQGQLIVCEADDADWLPFRPLVPMKGTEGRHKVSRARMEVIYP